MDKDFDCVVAAVNHLFPTGSKLRLLSHFWTGLDGLEKVNLNKALNLQLKPVTAIKFNFCYWYLFPSFSSVTYSQSIC